MQVRHWDFLMANVYNFSKQNLYIGTTVLRAGGGGHSLFLASETRVWIIVKSYQTKDNTEIFPEKKKISILISFYYKIIFKRTNQFLKIHLDILRWTSAFVWWGGGTLVFWRSECNLISSCKFRTKGDLKQSKSKSNIWSVLEI